MTMSPMTIAAVVQERRAGIDCDALEADLACMQRATGLAAGISAAREAQARCVDLRLVPSDCWHMCLDAPPTSGSLTG